MSGRDDVLAAVDADPAALGRVRRLRADAVADAFAEHPGRTDAGVLTVTTRTGAQVTFTDVQTVTDGDLTWVEVRVAGGTETAFRVINPPLLVPDESGDVTVGGARFREDPIAALAEALAAQGGAR